MRLRDYFVGIPVQLRSPLPPETVAERINAAAGSSFWPFSTDVVGGVWLGRVRLRLRESIAEYNAKPVLAGRLDGSFPGSLLSLRYRAPLWIYLFDAFWYGFLASVALMPLFADMNPDLTAADYLAIYGAYAVFALFPLGLHHYGTRHSDRELGYLRDFLAEHAQATASPSLFS